MNISWIPIQQNQNYHFAMELQSQTTPNDLQQQRPKARKYTLENRMKKQKIWTAEEDTLVLQLRQDGLKWNSVAAQINNYLYNGRQERRGKQCRERFNNHIDPNLKSKISYLEESWTEQEDGLLINLYKKLDSKWAVIAKQIQGRTENQVRNRIKSLLKKDPELTIKRTGDQKNLADSSFSSLAHDVKKLYDTNKEQNKQQQQMTCNQYVQLQQQSQQQFCVPVVYVIPQMTLIPSQLQYLTPVMPLLNQQLFVQQQSPVIQYMPTVKALGQTTPSNSIPFTNSQH